MDLFFGKKKTEKKPLTSAEAIKSMQDTLKLIEKREVHIQKQIDSLKEAAKGFLKKKDKNSAMYSIKKYKMLEKEKETLLGTKLNLEMQTMCLSGTVITSEIIKAMTHGRDAIKSESNLDVDKVADVMDELQEAMDDAKEVSELLSKPLGPEVSEDELAQLTQEILEEETMSVPTLTVPVWPQVPTAIPVATETPEEREVKKLREILN